jgi:hypothetical protein
LTFACGGSVGGQSASPDASNVVDVSADDRPISDDIAVGTDVANPTGDACLSASHDGGTCLIRASDYDQSCSTDSDCVRVAGGVPVDFGDYCQFLCRCGLDAINRGSANQYVGDVSRTPLGSGCTYGQICSCGFAGGPCCREHKCTTGSVCICKGPLCASFDDSGA